METNKNIQFNYFSGNIKLTRPLGVITLERFIDAHKNPKQETFEIIKKVQEASEAGDLAAKRAAKHQLYSFVPAALFKLGVARKYDNISEYTGLMQLDFDGIEDYSKAVDLKNYLFTTYQCVVCTYLSPSCKGVKALIRITKPRDKEHYHAIYKTVEAEFEQMGYFDTATKNIVLPLFLSIDRMIYSRDFSEAVPWDKEDWTKPQRNVYAPPPNLNSPSSKYQNAEEYYKDKTIKLFEKKIFQIDGNGHPQVRSACLVLGSRAGAGYITRAEAEQLAEYCISNNNYLSKNLNGYLSTSKWAINEGYNDPKQY